FFFSSRRRHTRWPRDWSSDVCSSDLSTKFAQLRRGAFDLARGRHLNSETILEVEEMMKHLSWSIALVALLACGFVSSAWAQATAQVSGTVKDQSGAVLPGVEVTATQTATGVKRTVLTNETGSYVLS